MAQVTCWKCGGSGYIPKYKHIDNGVCYACGGDGKLSETREKELSIEAFEKGTKKGGKTKHLFTVNPKHLDKKQLEKFRTRIKTRANELGVKLKAGFTTETALKKLQEAYREQHPNEEHTGNRLVPATATAKPEGSPKPSPKPDPKPEPKPDPKPQPKEEPKKATSKEEVEKIISVPKEGLNPAQDIRYKKRLREIADEFEVEISEVRFNIDEMRRRIAKKLGLSLPKDLKPKEEEERIYGVKEMEHILLSKLNTMSPEERLFIRVEIAAIAKQLKIDIDGLMLPDARKKIAIAIGMLDESEDNEAQYIKDLQERAAKQGYTIKKPLGNTNPSHVRLKSINSKKPQGVSKIPYDFDQLEDFLLDYTQNGGRGANPNTAKEVVTDVKEVFRRVEEEFPGLIGNVILKDFRMYVNAEDYLGKYTIAPDQDEFEIVLSLDNLIKFTGMKNRIISEMGEDFFNAERRSQLQQLKETLVHEFAHAYHHQVLLNYNHYGFAKVEVNKTAEGDVIINRYEKLIADIMKNSGMTRSQIQEIFYHPQARTLNDIVSQRFYTPYGATNAKEYFAVMTQKLATASARRKLQVKHPEDYAILKQLYEGVIDL